MMGEINWSEVMITLGSVPGVFGSFGAALGSVAAHKILAAFFGERSLPAGFFFFLTIVSLLVFVLSLALLLINLILRGWSFFSSR